MLEMISQIAQETFLDDDRRAVVDFLKDIIDTVDAEENTLYQPFIQSLTLLKEAIED